MPRLASLCLCLLLSLDATAAPLRSGPVQVDAKGKVTVDGSVVGRLPLPAGPRKLTQRRETVQGHRLLHLRVTGHGGRQAEMVLGPGNRVIFAGATGPQGVDGEWSRHVKVTEKGVLSFQRREGVTRCDAEPVYLFPRMYDFQAGRFRPVSAVPGGAGAKELLARRNLPGMPAGPPINTFRLTAATTVPGDGGEAANLAAPVRADDGDPATAWSEDLGGAGQGELLTARSEPSPYRLRAISIIPGDAASPAAFRRANRIKSALLSLSSTERYRIRFPTDPARTPGKPTDPFWVALPRPLATTCATLVIESVYPGQAARKGPGQGRTAISELRFFTDLELGGGLEQVARDLAAKSAQRGEAAVGILARLGTRGIEVVNKALAGETSPELRSRALRVLVKIVDPAAAEPLARLLPRLRKEQREEVHDALRRLGDAAIPQLTPLLDHHDGEVVAGVARSLGRIGGAHARDALLARVGRGSDTRRRAMVEGLVALPDATAALKAVLQAAEQADDRPARRADLVLTAGRLGQRAGVAAEAARRIAALWPTDGKAFELRYRMIAAVGRLDPVGQLDLLLRAVRAKDPVLRWLAAEQLRKVATDTSGEGPPTGPPHRLLKKVEATLRKLLQDDDPRVRATAALSLGQRGRDRATGLALARRLRKERWSLVARALAEALGRQCLPEGLSALRERMIQGPRGVDLRALISLAQCQPRGLDRELLAIAEETAWRTPMRRRALVLLTPRMVRANTGALVKLLGELRRRAIRSEDEEALAISAARALALAGNTRAADALADALALDPHEAIRAAAAAALGRLCQRSTRATLQRGRKDAAAVVRRAARRALARCKF